MKEYHQYIDAHLHLLDNRFSKHRAQIIQDALANGVEAMISNTTREAEWRQVIELSHQYPEVRPYIGVHPWFADTVEDGWLQRLEEILSEGVGVGEVGLDRLTRVDPAVQEEIFTKQLNVATRLEKPVTIHCIKAWGKLLDILQRYKKSHLRLLFHSFGGSQEIMTRLLNLGGYFSFSATLADPKRDKLRDVFLKVPLHRLLMETDAPDQYVPQLLNHENVQKNRQCNKPQYLPQIYAFAAELRRIDLQQFTTTVWENGQIFTH